MFPSNQHDWAFRAKMWHELRQALPIWSEYTHNSFTLLNFSSCYDGTNSDDVVLCHLFCSEENVWKLCEQVERTHPAELSKCYAVFVSNESRTVPLWRQKAGRGDDKVVIWVSTVWSNSINRTNYMYLLYGCPSYYNKFVVTNTMTNMAWKSKETNFHLCLVPISVLVSVLSMRLLTIIDITIIWVNRDSTHRHGASTKQSWAQQGELLQSFHFELP